MFPFSSYLLQIPLILFSAIYLLCFGAYALSKIKDREAGTETHAIEITGSSEVKNPGDQIYVFNYRSDTNEAANFHEDSCFLNKLSELITVYIPDKPLQACDRDFTLFSRPPPFLFS
jgi:hypothetical protein